MIPILWFFFPEVARLSLEEVDQLFVAPRSLIPTAADLCDRSFLDGKVHSRHNPNSSVGHLVSRHAGSSAGPAGSHSEKETSSQVELPKV
jgi:hypothetical protein